MIDYKNYTAEIEIIGQIEGGVPKDPAIIKTWLETKGISSADVYQETVAAMGGEANGDELQADASEKHWCGFKSGDVGLYIETRQIKAALKEAANVNKDALTKYNPKLKQAKARIAERVFIYELDDPDQIPLGRETPSGTEQRVVHAMSRRGPVHSIKLTDYVSAPILSFRIEVLDDGLFTKEALTALLEYMGRNGIGSNRSQGAGQFKLLELQEQG